MRQSSTPLTGSAPKETERRLRVLFDNAPDALVILDVESGRFLDANRAAEELFRLPYESLLEVGPFELSPPWQPCGLSAELGPERIAEAVHGGAATFEWWHRNANGERFPCDVHLVRIPWGDHVAIRGSVQESSHKKLLELSEIGRREVNDRIARGDSLARTLDRLLLTIEGLIPGMRCSILRLDPTTNTLRHLSAPNLPDFYNAAADGLKVGPTIGSCGAAAFHGQRFVVTDVANHPNWTAFREIAERAEVKACWSEPVVSLKGEVLGTFAMYYAEAVAPSPIDLNTIEVAAEIVANAITLLHAQQELAQMNAGLQRRVEEETRHLVEAKRQLELAAVDARLSAVAFEAYDSIIITDKTGTILRVNESFVDLTGYTSDEAVGRTPRILKSDRHDDDFYREIWEAISTRGLWSGEIWNKRKDGGEYLQRLTITAVRDESGEITHYIGDGQDITEEKRAELLRGELSAASTIQQSLLPSGDLCLPGFDVYGVVHPANEVGGDSFDYISIDPNATLLVVADVSGHGLGPGLLMAQMQSYLRCMSQVVSDPGEILTRANQFFSTGDLGCFVTMFLGRLNTATRRFTYACAGHQGHLVKANGGIRTLKSLNLPVGFEEEWDGCEQQAVDLEAGDILLIPTDGIEEAFAPNGECFGRERMFEIVRNNAAQSASQIVDKLYDALREFCGEPKHHDDVTAVVVKVLDSPSPQKTTQG